ncbi:MAG: tRNA preQ1(34) S-adenosylmethionine ribosyltransferase-isomerase QueA [Patescibacteria group bacterium]
MKTTEFDYFLPLDRIAQKPIEPRDNSKLLVVDTKSKKTTDKKFFEIVDFLQKGDLLVLNNSKVFKARLFGRLEAADSDLDKNNIPDKPLLNQQEVEIFLVRQMENSGVWKVLAKPGKRVKPGMLVRFAPDFFCKIIAKEISGEILVQFDDEKEKIIEKANKYGKIPVPPYVKTEPKNFTDYQTIYAKNVGSVAAPTAGFHFTPELIARLKEKGIEFAEITLHVGLGTFLPVKTEDIEDHKMHSEYIELDLENAEKINKAKKEGRRVIAVGTTSVRTLEGIASLASYQDGKLEAFKGDINIFITLGFKFKVVDALITNFHLPKSTLLMLVCAFASNKFYDGNPKNFAKSLVDGKKFMLDVYEQAIEKEYRFYSFGDAMIIK